MKKIIFFTCAIFFSIALRLYYKPYGVFDLSFSVPESDQETPITIHLDKIEAEMNNRVIKFSISDHPTEINDVWFSKNYSKYWNKRPSMWIERHGVSSSRFYEESLKIISSRSNIEKYNRCVFDVDVTNVISYNCYTEDNFTDHGIIADIPVEMKIFIARLKVYDKKIGKMGPINECVGNVGYCDR